MCVSVNHSATYINWSQSTWPLTVYKVFMTLSSKSPRWHIVPCTCLDIWVEKKIATLWSKSTHIRYKLHGWPMLCLMWYRINTLYSGYFNSIPFNCYWIFKENQAYSGTSFFIVLFNMVNGKWWMVKRTFLTMNHQFQNVNSPPSSSSLNIITSKAPSQFFLLLTQIQQKKFHSILLIQVQVEK